MTKLLNRELESEIAQTVVETLQDQGYTADEMVTGVVAAVVILARRMSPMTVEVIDEAVDLLIDAQMEEDDGAV